MGAFLFVVTKHGVPLKRVFTQRVRVCEVSKTITDNWTSMVLPKHFYCTSKEFWYSLIPMKALLLKLLGYEVRKPSPILMSMARFTHSSWLEDLHAQNRISDFEYNLYTK